MAQKRTKQEQKVYIASLHYLDTGDNRVKQEILIPFSNKEDAVEEILSSFYREFEGYYGEILDYAPPIEKIKKTLSKKGRLHLKDYQEDCDGDMLWELNESRVYDSRDW